VPPWLPTSPLPTSQSSAGPLPARRGPPATSATGPGAVLAAGGVPPYPETQAAYAYAGVSIPRTSEAQFAYGPQVSLDAIAPRDLPFIAGSDGTAAAPGHVGIYLGAGQALQMIAALANQLTGPSGGGGPVPVNDPVAAKAIEFARSKLGLPYQWQVLAAPYPGQVIHIEAVWPDLVGATRPAALAGR